MTPTVQALRDSMTTQELIDAVRTRSEEAARRQKELDDWLASLEPTTNEFFEARDAAIIADYIASPDSFKVGDRVRIKEEAYHIDWHGTDDNFAERFPRGKEYTVTDHGVMGKFPDYLTEFWIVLYALDENYVSPDPNWSDEMNGYQRKRLSLTTTDLIERA